jgi:hypothetical protein
LKGGGLFNTIIDSQFINENLFYLASTIIRNNEASIGGGVFLENSEMRELNNLANTIENNLGSIHSKEKYR